MLSAKAEPYDFEFDPKTTALVMIDFQRDFVYPGGFGESLGNDTSFLLKALPPAERVLKARRAATPKPRGPRQLIVCGVTTEVCVQTSVREANDRGYDACVLEDCVGSYFPEFQKAALDMVKAQGGIFGFVSDSTRFLDALGKQFPAAVRAAAGAAGCLSTEPATDPRGWAGGGCGGRGG